jgi:hypothetical protein
MAAQIVCMHGLQMNPITFQYGFYPNALLDRPETYSIGWFLHRAESKRECFPALVHGHKIGH